MWPKIRDSKVFEWIMTITIAIMTVLLTQNIISRREGLSNVKQEFAIRPTYQYVDSQDDNIEKKFEQYKIEAAKTDETLMQYIKSMDGKIDILINRIK